MKPTEQSIFIHETAVCGSKNIGKDTRIWAFTNILEGAKIGTSCNICDHVFIENDVVVGNDVTIKCGVQLWDGVRLEDNVFIGPNATFTNDIFPRSKCYPEQFLQTIVEKGASIGANATILPGIRICQNSMVGAGSVVTRDIPPNAIVVGNPAKIIGYNKVTETKTVARPINRSTLLDKPGSTLDLGIGGCRLERLPNFEDIRGGLTPLEKDSGLPFEPKRVFLVYDVQSDQVRGEHAHRECEQFLVASNGGVSVVVDDGVNNCEVRLDDRTVGLYLAPGVWGIQYKFSSDCVLMVAASHNYDPKDYIRDYKVFLDTVSDE